MQSIVWTQTRLYVANVKMHLVFEESSDSWRAESALDMIDRLVHNTLDVKRRRRRRIFAFNAAGGGTHGQVFELNEKRGKLYGKLMRSLLLFRFLFSRSTAQWQKNREREKQTKTKKL